MSTGGGHGPHGNTHSNDGSFTDETSWGVRDLNQQHSLSFGTTSVKALTSDVKSSLELLKKATEEARNSLPIKYNTSPVEIDNKMTPKSVENLLKYSEGSTKKVYKYGSVHFNVNDIEQETGSNVERTPHNNNYTFDKTNQLDTPQETYSKDININYRKYGEGWNLFNKHLNSAAADYELDYSPENTHPDDVSGTLIPGQLITKQNSIDILNLINKRKFTNTMDSFGTWNVTGTLHGNHGNSHSD